MRSGHISTLKIVDRQVFRLAGVDSYGWTSGAIDKSEPTTAYILGFGTSDIDPSYGPTDRRLIFSLRCLSTTAVGTTKNVTLLSL